MKYDFRLSFKYIIASQGTNVGKEQIIIICQDHKVYNYLYLMHFVTEVKGLF